VADGPVVSNTGPLLAFALVGRLDLVGSLFGEVLVPDAVYQEIVEAGAGRVGAAELRVASWAVRCALEVPIDRLLAEEVGPGEAAAITLAAARGASLLLIDDKKARRIAELAYRIPVRGVAGCLVFAKRNGLIERVVPLLMQMRSAGYFLSERLIESTRQAAGE
jgi:predicted nucleic acid-binding protein